MHNVSALLPLQVLGGEEEVRNSYSAWGRGMGYLPDALSWEGGLYQMGVPDFKVSSWGWARWVLENPCLLTLEISQMS